MRRHTEIIGTFILIMLTAGTSWGCDSVNKDSTRSRQSLPVGDPRALYDQTSAYAQELSKAFKLSTDFYKFTPTPGPCKPPEDTTSIPVNDLLDNMKDPGVSPYNMLSTPMADDITPTEINPALERFRAYLQDEGWEITKYSPLKEEGHPQTSATLIARHQNGYSVMVKGLADLKRIFYNLASPCLRHPAAT